MSSESKIPKKDLRSVMAQAGSALTIMPDSMFIDELLKLDPVDGSSGSLAAGNDQEKKETNQNTIKKG